MKKRNLLSVMFVLFQMVVAGLMFGDVRAGNSNGPSGQTALGVASSLTHATPVSMDKGSGRRRVGTQPKPEPELQFEGKITAASATSITVHDSHGNDVVIALTSTTVIRHGNTAIAAADLKVGDQVHVQATSAGSVITAFQVIVQQSADDHHSLEVEGTITAASATSITVHDEHGADVILTLTAGTIIRKGDATIAATDLKVGDVVEVQAVTQDSVNTALIIHVESEHHDSASVSGTVSSISGTEFTVHTEHGDVGVKTDASTVVRKQGKTIAVSDIHTGDSVSASGTLAADLSLLATEIEVRNQPHH